MTVESHKLMTQRTMMFVKEGSTFSIYLPDQQEVLNHPN